MMGSYGVSAARLEYSGDYSGEFSQFSIRSPWAEAIMSRLAPSMNWSTYDAYPVYPGE